jgi:ribosome-binding factor A
VKPSDGRRKKSDGGRAARLGEAMKGEIADVIARELKDPRVHAAGLLTVTHVVLGDDLRLARVLVSFVGGSDDAAAAAIAALARSAGFVRGEVGRRLGLRYAPELRFVHDKSAEQAARIDAILREDEGRK